MVGSLEGDLVRRDSDRVTSQNVQAETAPLNEVVGDFNIPNTTGPMYKAVTAKGLKMPSSLAGVHGSDLAKSKRYDQILHLPHFTEAFTGAGGVLDFYCNAPAQLFPGKKLTKLEFTFRLSDHLSLWVQLNTDDDAEKLDQILNAKRGGARSR